MISSSTDLKEIRRFGAIAFIFFGFLCIAGIWTKKLMPTYLFSFLSILGLGFIIMPSRLRPIYYVWLKVTHSLGSGLTTLILSMAYYIVITPSAFLKRLFGGRPVPVKPDKEALSYWVARTEPAQIKERFLKRY